MSAVLIPSLVFALVGVLMMLLGVVSGAWFDGERPIGAIPRTARVAPAHFVAGLFLMLALLAITYVVPGPVTMVVGAVVGTLLVWIGRFAYEKAYETW